MGKNEHHIKNSQDFANTSSGLKVDEDETITSYDVTALFTCIPPDGAVSVVHEYQEKDATLLKRTKMSPSQICELLNLCLTTTYFVCNSSFYRQIHGCAMGSPISPIVVSLYMERFEEKALESYESTPPSHWFRYVDDTWVKIRKDEARGFFDHIDKVDNNIKFKQEEIQDGVLPFLDSKVMV